MQATRWTQGGHRHGQHHSHEHEAPPQLHFGKHAGGDIDAYAALWFAEMERWVLRDGEEIVCPQIFTTCFQSDDAVKTWYLGMPSVLRTRITTKPGCWNLFKQFLLMRFLIGDGPRLRQLAAEEVREHRPGVPCATFAIWKIYYIQCADPHLAPGAAIAMVKRELGWEAALFCREQENIDDFISELTEFDEQQLEREFAEDAVARWFAEVDRNVHQDGEEIVCPQVFADSFQSDDGFKVWCLGMPSVVTTMITTKPGCWNRFKSLFSKWFFTDVSPSIADFTSELTEFDEQQLEQQDYPDIAINEPEHPEEITMTTNDGEFNADRHDERSNMKNAGPFNAERHQKLTAGSKASGALNAQQLEKEVIRASTLWFASARCYEDELRDGIG
jgi:hypothetical protein